MERIIDYSEIPYATNGQSVYLTMGSEPNLYLCLFQNGYHIINHLKDADSSTIFVTGRKQDYFCSSEEEYREKMDNYIQNAFQEHGITKPHTVSFSYQDLLDHKYHVPFVLKNEDENCGREKFLIATEEDYIQLIKTCHSLFDKRLLDICASNSRNPIYKIDYEDYLSSHFRVQEYIQTPSQYNTTVRVLTSPAQSVLYASLKYNLPEKIHDKTSMLGTMLSEVYPLSTDSIVSNTAAGGENCLIDGEYHTDEEKDLLRLHHIDSDGFHQVLEASKDVHEKFRREIGVLCGFDYIYDPERDQWFLLEYHNRPMVGDYSKRCGVPYDTFYQRKFAEGRVRATAFNQVLQKTR